MPAAIQLIFGTGGNSSSEALCTCIVVCNVHAFLIIEKVL